MCSHAEHVAVGGLHTRMVSRVGDALSELELEVPGYFEAARPERAEGRVHERVGFLEDIMSMRRRAASSGEYGRWRLGKMVSMNACARPVYSDAAAPSGSRALFCRWSARSWSATSFRGRSRLNRSAFRIV